MNVNAIRPAMSIAISLILSIIGLLATEDYLLVEGLRLSGKNWSNLIDRISIFWPQNQM